MISVDLKELHPMLMAGAEPIWLAKQMGHSDWGMIRKTYGKWIAEERPNHRAEIAKKLGQSGVTHIQSDAFEI